MVRALHGRSVLFCSIVLFAFAGSANATVITQPGQLFEDFAGFTSNTLFGWYSAGGGTGTLTGAPTANLDGQHGSCVPSGPGDCTYLEVKDTGTQGSFVSAGTAWGTTAAPVSYATWNGMVVHYEVADLKNGGGAPAIAASFATTFFSGNHVRTVNSCTSGCTFTNITIYTTMNTGQITANNTWYNLSANFIAGSFKIMTGTAPSGTDSFIGNTQFADLIAAVTNISIDTSLQTSNSSDIIGVDEFGFQTPEPSSMVLAAAGLIGVLAIRKRSTAEVRRS